MITHHDMCVGQHLSQNQYHKSSNSFQQYLHNFDCIQKCFLYTHQFLSSDKDYMNMSLKYSVNQSHKTQTMTSVIICVQSKSMRTCTVIGTQCVTTDLITSISVF